MQPTRVCGGSTGLGCGSRTPLWRVGGATSTSTVACAVEATAQGTKDIKLLLRDISSIGKRPVLMYMYICVYMYICISACKMCILCPIAQLSFFPCIYKDIHIHFNMHSHHACSHLFPHMYHLLPAREHRRSFSRSPGRPSRFGGFGGFVGFGDRLEEPQARIVPGGSASGEGGPFIPTGMTGPNEVGSRAGVAG
jgi:hypothetical protein